jgi:hypothetical protein
MSFLFCTKDGGLYLDGVRVATGYSGHGPGRNSPEHESEPRVGPIPRGTWRIVGPPVDTEEHGPYVLALTPMPGTETFGRSGFLCHGDSVRAPGTASLGCIILPRSTRQALWESGERQLVVVGIPPSEDLTPAVT